LRIVLDTNVLVSGFLNPHGWPGRILDLVQSGAIKLLVDDRILAEYRTVLTRPRFGFPPEDIAAFLDLLSFDSEPVAARPLSATLPDPADLPFLEVAVAGRAEALVTGNLRHFAEAEAFLGRPAESPADFIGRLQLAPKIAP
jgi:uncharacterized protein